MLVRVIDFWNSTCIPFLVHFLIYQPWLPLKWEDQGHLGELEGSDTLTATDIQRDR
jgi:hypothetical protein